MARVYLDHNATTFPYPEVLEEVARVSSSDWANPSSLHADGRRARQRLDDARDRVARALGVRAAEVYFTSGATESNNLALEGIGPKSLAVSAIEHPSVMEPARRLAGAGVALTILPVDKSGRIRLEALEVALAERPTLLSVMAASNETGVLQPLEDIGCRCLQARVPLHVDATQLLGREPFLPGSLPIDLVSASGHKIHGPRGIGILWCRQGVRLASSLAGGTQERGLRPGTENVAGACGLALALELVTARLIERRATMLRLRDRLAAGLLALEPGIVRNGDTDGCLPNTLNLQFPGRSAETLLLALDLQEVEASSGSACASGAVEPSPVLLAMGLSRREAQSSIRLSLDDSNTDADIDHAVDAFRSILSRLSRSRPARR